jgi:hypothetical protein
MGVEALASRAASFPGLAPVPTRAQQKWFDVNRLSDSAVVREGLLLLHRRARELTAAAEYEKFYGGQPAPLPDGVIPADAAPA